jgi:hypothetical protein
MNSYHVTKAVSHLLGSMDSVLSVSDAANLLIRKLHTQAKVYIQFQESHKYLNIYLRHKIKNTNYRKLSQQEA